MRRDELQVVGTGASLQSSNPKAANGSNLVLLHCSYRPTVYCGTSGQQCAAANLYTPM